ncbi:hypothetical protein [Deinococcus radiophilus]|uniref:Uncharacterized protein n=1 Tax=Deinococcus radiophilus TaxID=32062 RepID=A0A3S0HWI3_9DEIO|nr:hypothetical protein [Deinococcus radiophilus]RTR18836.1 hypothetical protein EJ104_13580 [Deinococcus radiophilus]UFA51916.1 hypothetical protein LMT64_13385 [Deinococcus radiophilus]
MAITRKPQRQVPVVETTEQPDEQAALEVIQRGGSVQGDQQQSPAQEAELTDPLKNVQLRLYQSTLDEIDTLRKEQAKGRRPASRHAWIIAAIEEKLGRER